MKKKTMMKSFLIAGIAAASLGAFAANNSVQADAATTFAMQSGASVRLTEGSTGIRFTAHVDEVEAGANYGVIIAPTAYFMEGGEYVTGNYHAHLNAKYNVKVEDEVTDLGYLDLASKPTEVTDNTSEYYGKYAIKGSIARMNFDNMNLSFTGIAYKEVDGVYTYATFENFEDISRSVTNVSSRATQDVQYETKYTPAQQTIIENFLVDGIAEAAGATKTDTTYTYNETQYDVEGLMAAIQPTVTITGVEDSLSFLRKADVTATFSVAGADLNMVWSASNALQVTGNTVQAINIGEGSVSVKAGPFMATETVTVPEPTDMSEAGYVIADMDNGNALSTTIQGFNVALAEAVYDATDAEGPADCVDLQYADGKLGATLTAGEKMIFAPAVDGNTYMLSGIASDCVINDSAEFKAWATDMGASAYAILANDVTVDSGELITTTQFKGVFNGLGYTVKNPGFYYGIFRSDLHNDPNSVIKNVTMTGIELVSWSLLGGWTGGGKMENVHIEAKFLAKPNTSWSYMFAKSLSGNWVFTDCSFVFTVDSQYEADNHQFWAEQHADYTLTFNNCFITNNAGVVEATSGIILNNTTVFDRDDYGKEKYMVATDNKLALSIEGDVKNVWINGKKVAATQSETQLSVPVTAYGDSNILVQKEDNTCYGVKTVVADYAATNYETYKAFFATDSIYLNSKYMVIAADIDCGLTYVENINHAKTLSSVIDGLGHTITNQKGSRGLFYHNTSNITVKNVTFDNFQVAELQYGKLLGRYCQSMVYDHVHFKNLTIPDTFFTSSQTGLFMWGNGDGWWVAGAFVLKMSNCTFDIKCSDAYVDNAFLLMDDPTAYPASFTNVTINYNGTIKTYDASNTTNAKYENGTVPVTKFTNVVINDKTGTKTYNN